MTESLSYSQRKTVIDGVDERVPKKLLSAEILPNSSEQTYYSAIVTGAWDIADSHKELAEPLGGGFMIWCGKDRHTLQYLSMIYLTSPDESPPSYMCISVSNAEKNLSQRQAAYSFIRLPDGMYVATESVTKDINNPASITRKKLKEKSAKKLYSKIISPKARPDITRQFTEIPPRFQSFQERWQKLEDPDVINFVGKNPKIS